MSLSGGVALLATKVANYLRDSVLPRLMPRGGIAGQTLVKGNATDFNAAWGALPVTGGGTGATTPLGARNALELSAVAATGQYSDLSNRPDLSGYLTQSTADARYASKSAVAVVDPFDAYAEEATLDLCLTDANMMPDGWVTRDGVVVPLPVGVGAARKNGASFLPKVTNLFRQTEDLTTSAWQAGGASVGAASRVADPLGGSTAQRVTLTNGNSLRQFGPLPARSGGYPNGVITSVWLRRVNGNSDIVIDMAGYRAVIPLTSQWQQFTFAYPYDVSSYDWAVVSNDTLSNVIDVWHPMMEAGPKLSGYYAPSTTEPVSIFGESLIVPYAAGWQPAELTAFTVLIEGIAPDKTTDAGLVGLMLNGGDPILGLGVSGPNGYVRQVETQGGSPNTNGQLFGGPNVGKPERFALAVAYGGFACAFAARGQSVLTSLQFPDSGTPYTNLALMIGSDGAAAWNSSIRRVQVIPRLLTGTELNAFTAN